MPPSRERESDRRDGWLLLVVAAWTLYVWVTRAFLLARDFSSDPAPVVHALLTVVSLIAGIVVGFVGVRLLRRAR